MKPYKSSYYMAVALWLELCLLACACTSGRPTPSHTAADSLYTTAYIRQIAGSQPERALALIDTAECKRLLSTFDLNDLRSTVYHNGLSHYKTALHYARKAYYDPQASRHPERLLHLLVLMAEDSHNNGAYAESVGYCAEGLKLASQTGNKTQEANLHVSWGLNLLEMEQFDEAFAYIDLAVNVLADEARNRPCFDTWDGLFYALGMKLNLLWDKDRYVEAEAMHPLFDEALCGLAASPDTPEGMVNMRRAEADVVFSCIAYASGHKRQADSLYHRVESNPYASTPDGEYIRIPCLVLSGRYDEALECLRREKHLLKQTTDTVNWDYINPHLQMELEAYQGKGDWKSAAQVQATMLALTDSLRQRERHNDALELAEIYKTDEQSKEIERQAGLLQTHRVVLWLLSVILLLVVVYLRHILKIGRVVSRKNKAMAQVIDEIMAYKDELFARHEENISLQQKLLQLADVNSSSVVTKSGRNDISEETETARIQPSKRNRMLYEQVIHEVIGRKLYLRPGFDVKALQAEAHIPVRKLNALFQNFAGCTLAQFLDDCRLDHAVRLMRRHPQWSMDDIARESRMPKDRFYVLFQNKYGMKPHSYHAQKSWTALPIVRWMVGRRTDSGR